jgi:hypothetical protein
VFADEITSRVLAQYDAGGLVTLCGWCKRVRLDNEWHLTPLTALAGTRTTTFGGRAHPRLGESNSRLDYGLGANAAQPVLNDDCARSRMR